MGRSAPRPRPRILSVSPAFEDHVALRRILDRPQWRLDTAGSCGEALAYLREGGAVVIFCEHSLPDGSWKKVLDQAAANNAPPVVVVTSRLADDRLWAEVLNLGGFDVLAKPFDDREVRHVLASAVSLRMHPRVGDSRTRTAEIA